MADVPPEVHDRVAKAHLAARGGLRAAGHQATLPLCSWRVASAKSPASIAGTTARQRSMTASISFCSSRRGGCSTKSATCWARFRVRGWPMPMRRRQKLGLPSTA
ncbi:hypothetical protein G6F32_016291 [Rhizopus arrhizus]|nr:hypothetical protein G6F32_016291 [Rhizopus arrhizus]